VKSKILARKLFHNLIHGLGVDCAVVCAGARNAPLVRALEESGLQSFHFFHENAAGFFALGLAKKGKTPVVLCTSGTAVAQLLSPCIEAYYDEQFLVFLTADRPKTYRNSGAPQTIKQNKIFSDFVSQALDIEQPEDILKQDFVRHQPVHINVCLDSPLWWEDEEVEALDQIAWNYEAKNESKEFPEVVFNAQRSLLIASRLTEDEAKQVDLFLRKNSGLNLYLEASSGLVREDYVEKHNLLYSEQELIKSFKKNSVNQILHLGGVPTNKLWRLIADSKEVKVYSFGRTSYSGLLHAKRWIASISSSLLDKLNFENNETQLKQNSSAEFESFVSDFPSSEAAIFPVLKKSLKQTDYVYVGNSMPIRYFDMGSLPQIHKFDCNRGVNGIDGQVASFLGGIPEEAERAVCILGDLTFFYDLTALWATKYVDCENICIVIVNNSGGKIFDRVFPRNPFANPHDFNFQNIADFYSYSYRQNIDEGLPEKGRWIIELRPDEQETNLFHKHWDEVWK
jgi:2-succinyl-5-enolpyruvyl-6-hydroxy-3-cyclohexene-1-carboxylate synthase